MTARLSDILQGWYPLPEDARVLRLPAPESAPAVAANAPWDYILLEAGVLEAEADPAALLARLREKLAPGGRLLLLVENRFALRGFCGDAHAATGLPFSGIRGVRRFSRGDIKTLLGQAGFPRHKLYLVLPSHEHPRVVVAENHPLQAENFNRLLFPHRNPSAMLLPERALYPDIAREGMLPFFANSFLVECRLAGDACPVSYVATTLERPPQRRFATAICEDGTVRKAPLCPEGQPSLEKLEENLCALDARGVRTVPHRLEGGALLMPRFDGEMLEAVQKQAALASREAAFALFDRLWALVLQSSEEAPAEANPLLGQAPNADWGPILRTAFIEMIPLNAFEKDGEIYFYDQEFTRENFPARFVMFRAVRNAFTWGGSAVSREDLKDRYGLSPLWDIFEAEERRFLHDVNDEEGNAWLYAHYRQDPGQMAFNALALALMGLPEATRRRGWRRVLVYGYGAAGAEAAHRLLAGGIEVPCAVDRKAAEILESRYTEVPLLAPDAALPPADALIVTAKTGFEEIAQGLRGRFGGEIIDLYALLRDI